MRVSQPFLAPSQLATGNHESRPWFVHVMGDVCDGAPSMAVAAVKTKRGWCYFRRATAREVGAKLAGDAESLRRMAQFATERVAAREATS